MSKIIPKVFPETPKDNDNDNDCKQENDNTKYFNSTSLIDHQFFSTHPKAIVQYDAKGRRPLLLACKSGAPVQAIHACHANEQRKRRQSFVDDGNLSVYSLSTHGGHCHHASKLSCDKYNDDDHNANDDDDDDDDHNDNDNRSKPRTIHVASNPHLYLMNVCDFSEF